MIQSLPLPIFLAMLAFPLAMAGICVYAGIFARRRAALVQQTKTSRIRVAIPGYVEFEGNVEAIDGQTVIAPLTLSHCCWYRARVEKWDRGSPSRSHGHWQTVKDESSDAPFFIRDVSGVCAVHPYGAEVTPTDKSLWYGATEEPEDRDPPRVGPGESAKGWIEVQGGPNSKFRYSEERIYDGDPLFVLGVFSKEPPEPEIEDDEEPAEDQSMAEAVDGMDQAAPEDAAAAPDAVEDLNGRALRVTFNRIARGPKKEPLILSTTPQEAHIDLTARGGLAAFFIAIVPLALAVLLLWARFG